MNGAPTVRRHACLLFLALASAPLASAQEKMLSTLPDIWNAIWMQSTQIRAAAADVTAASAGVALTASSYLPSVKMSLDRTYNATALSEEGDWAGCWNATLGVQQPIPGGGSISTGLADGLTEVAFIGGIADINFPSVYLAISQSLFPFWHKRGAQDPLLEAATIQRLQSSVAVRKIRRDLAIQAAEQFLQLRQLEREMSYLHDQIALQEEVQQSQESMQSQGSTALSEVWKSQTAVWEQKQRFLQAQAQEAEVRESLRGLAHVSVGAVSGSILPELLDSCTIVPSVEEDGFHLSIREAERKLTESLQSGAPQVSASISRALVIRPAGWDTLYESAYSLSMKDTWAFSFSLFIPTDFLVVARLQGDIAKAHQEQYTALIEAERDKVASRRRVLAIRLSGIDVQMASLSEELRHAQEMTAAVRTQVASGQAPAYQAGEADLVLKRIRTDLDNLGDKEWLTRFYLAVLSGWPQ